MGNMRCSKCDKYHDECTCEMTELRDECDELRACLTEAEKEREEMRSLFKETLDDIREYLEEMPCSGPCDSYGVCRICTVRSATFSLEVYEKVKNDAETPTESKKT